MVGIKQQSIEHGAQDGPIPTMLFHRFADSLFQFPIASPHQRVHRNAQIGFFLGRQFSRDVFEEYEGTELHQKFAEEQGRCTRLSAHCARRLRFRAAIVFWLNLGDRFKNPVILSERASSGCTPFVSVLFHSSRFEAEQGVEEIVRIPDEKSAGEAHNPVCARSQSTQRIALCRISRELMNLVADA